MTLYKCPCGKQEKEISKAIIGLRDGKWVCVDAKCECGKYMDSEPTEGMPSIKRTEASLSKKNAMTNFGMEQKKSYVENVE